MPTASDYRQSLIEDHLGLAHSIAKKVFHRAPSHVTLEDLVSYGQVGLAEAARDFDPNRNTQFSTYAYYRIRGAIYDGLSRMAWGSRSRYNQVRYEQLANEVLGEDAEQSQAEKESSLLRDSHWLGDMSLRLTVVYLASQGDDDSGKQESPVDSKAEVPLTVLARREILLRLHKFIEELPEQVKLLLKAVYFDGLSLTEAGKSLGISKSWASRLHVKGLDQLARSLKQIGVDQAF